MLAAAAIALAAFGLGLGLAELFGAANLGTALGIGQIAFAAALVWVLLFRNPEPAGDEREMSGDRPQAR